ncbi:hypothetical protein THAOC_29635 [Thalassiosira oceanica]|uniref:Uncharacterized protein n=1 Tax=Thalassiosira oceanica TaxID=159749 RepID=K0RDF8_THAOC|nr:hypothetical protein THAOC_29635 [Thalassiosira oceanica]|eukprot:EJK51215.1 hypothetical protein THAOC_29635 [Thalassiosira oceanica]
MSLAADATAFTRGSDVTAFRYPRKQQCAAAAPPRRQPKQLPGLNNAMGKLAPHSTSEANCESLFSESGHLACQASHEPRGVPSAVEVKGKLFGKDEDRDDLQLQFWARKIYLRRTLKSFLNTVTFLMAWMVRRWWIWWTEMWHLGLKPVSGVRGDDGVYPIRPLYADGSIGSAHGLRRPQTTIDAPTLPTTIDLSAPMCAQLMCDWAVFDFCTAFSIPEKESSQIRHMTPLDKPLLQCRHLPDLRTSNSSYVRRRAV